MSLFIDSENTYSLSPIYDPACRGKTRIRSKSLIPQQAQSCAPQAKISVIEESHCYVVSSELLGVELENLWACIEGRTLSIYAGVTGEKQRKSGEYRFTEELIGGIRGEITLPDQASHNPQLAEFADGVLTLILPKKTNRFSGK